MTATTTPTTPAPKPPPAAPHADPFPPAPEVGDLLRGLGDAQAAIDRKKAEELARLRAIQDRD